MAFEERLWVKLEEKHGGRVWEIKEEILKEVKHLLSQQDIMDKKLQTHHQLSPELSNRMAKQLILQQADNGKTVTSSQIEELKQLMISVPPTSFHGLKDGKIAIYMPMLSISLAEALIWEWDLKHCQKI